MMEHPRTTKYKDVRIWKSIENAISIRESQKPKNKKMKNKLRPHCQSMIMSYLFVSAEKMMEKTSWCFSWVPL